MRSQTFAAAILFSVLGYSALSANVIRFRFDGNWNDLDPSFNEPTLDPDTNGWLSPSLPGAGDTARINWGGNTVTVTDTQTVGQIQIAVDESGNLVVENGGTLSTLSTILNGRLSVGNNRSFQDLSDVGTLTVKTGGTVNVSDMVFVGQNADGIANVSGTLNITSHLWVGWGPDIHGGQNVTGVVNIHSGGVVNVGGAFGLDFQDNGATGEININNGGELNLASVSPGNFNGDGRITITGSGFMTAEGNDTADFNTLIDNGIILGGGGAPLQAVYDNVEDITIVSVVPEANAAALLLGLASIAYVGLRRRI